MNINKLWNQHTEDWKELTVLYREFFGLNENQYIINGNKWQGMKLIASQYNRYRSQLMAVKDPNEIARWINANQWRFLNVPLQHVYSDRSPRPFIRFEFTRFEVKEDLNEIHHHLRYFEEEIRGPGYAGEFRVYIPYNPLRYDDGAIKVAMASYGIYPFEIVYGYEDDNRFVEGRFVMRQQDWNFNVDFLGWNLEGGQRRSFNDDDDYDDDPEDDSEDVIWDKIFDKLEQEDEDDL